MAYFAPYIDDSGLHIPTYQDIMDYLEEQVRLIFGNDIYLATMPRITSFCRFSRQSCLMSCSWPSLTTTTAARLQP